LTSTAVPFSTNGVYLIKRFLFCPVLSVSPCFVASLSVTVSSSGTEDTLLSCPLLSVELTSLSPAFNSSEENTIISIHQNKFSESKYHGTQIFYSPNNSKSKQLADSIKFSVKGLLQPDNERECKKADSGIYLLKNTSNPAVIVECGFISNEEECNNLLNSQYKKQMAFSITSGFLTYYNSD